VPRGVVHYVGERVPHFAWRAQDAIVVAIGEELAGASPERVQAFRDADRKGLDAARERRAIARLANQVHVIALHRIVHESKAFTLAHRRECGGEDGEDAPMSQAR